MLYLKLAQLRGQLQSSRNEANAAEDASDRHTMFRTHVMTRMAELRREVQVWSIGDRTRTVEQEELCVQTENILFLFH